MRTRCLLCPHPGLYRDLMIVKGHVWRFKLCPLCQVHHERYQRVKHELERRHAVAQAAAGREQYDMAQRQVSAAVAWTLFLLNYLWIGPEMAYEVWTALERSDAGRTLLFQWNAMCRSSNRAALIEQLLEHSLSPQGFVTILEALCEQQHLSRQQVNLLEAAILERTDASGRWIANP